MKLNGAVVLIWISFLLRGSFYATVIPLWENLDEFAHFAYVDWLRTHATLPDPDARVSEEVSRSLRLVPIPWGLNDWPEPAATHDTYWNLSPEERSARQTALATLPSDTQPSTGTDFLYEGKQPPLYYMISAPVLQLAQGSSLPSRVLVLRLFTVFLASFLVPLTFAVAMRAMGKTSPALFCAILITAMPVLLMTASRIANDALASVLFSVLTWALLSPQPWSPRGSLLIGVTLGAGLLTKVYFIASVPIVVLSGAAAIWKAPSRTRARTAGFIAGAALLAFAISAWWYVRVLGATGPVWADVAPHSSMSIGELTNYLLQFPLRQAVRGALDLHFWFGGWSFLAVRSWIYMTLQWLFMALVLGSFLAMLRRRSATSVVWGLYGCFWAAMMYHALIFFISAGIPSSTGSYLYAVIACEAVILCSGVYFWFRQSWQSRAMVVIIGLFLLLETYATHFVLIPYYTGLIRHRPDTSLLAFHVSQAFDVGWREILLRLATNKAGFAGPWTIASVWVLFLAASASLFLLAWREMKRSAEPRDC